MMVKPGMYPLVTLCLVISLSLTATAFVPEGRSGRVLQRQYVEQLPFQPSAAHRRSSVSLNAFSQEQQEVEVSSSEVERPDPSILLSAKGDSAQRFGFVAICASLAIGTYLAVDLLSAIEWILPDNWFDLWRDYTWPVPLGLIFLAAGVAHFLQKDAFIAMVPPPGTWGGLWKVRHHRK